MKYLNQAELSTAKKLLLEAGGEPREYWTRSFANSGAVLIINFLLKAERESYLTVFGMKIGKNFFERMFSGHKYFTDLDNRPVSVVTDIRTADEEKIKKYDYIGLGKDVFARYREKCCRNKMLELPVADLDISQKELAYILENRGHFTDAYSHILFESISFLITQNVAEKRSLEKWLDEYLTLFRNDDLESENAVNHLKYAKQKELLDETLEHFRKNYRIKNLWLNEYDIRNHGNLSTDNQSLSGYN